MNTMKAFSWMAGGREGGREHAPQGPSEPLRRRSKGGWVRDDPPQPFPAPPSLTWAPTEVLGRGDVGEHKQREVLHDVEAEVEAAKRAVAGTRGRAAEVVVPVGEGHQEARRRVQADAEAPHVALGHLPADGRAHRRQVIGHLESCDPSGGRPPLAPPTWRCFSPAIKIPLALGRLHSNPSHSRKSSCRRPQSSPGRRPLPRPSPQGACSHSPGSPGCV